MAEEGLAKKRGEFEDTQLQKLDTSVDHTNPDEVLRVANDIRIISDKVFTDINSDKKLKKALSAAFIKTFSKAESEARAEVEIDENIPGAEKEKVARARAFRKAFRSVYGRFMLEEQDDALDAIGKSNADTLKGVLKFPIEDKDKLKGRSELKSALSRLRKASLAANDPDFENRIVGAAFPKMKSGAEMERLKRKHRDAEHEEHEIQDVYKFFSGHDSFTKVVESSSQLAEAIKDWEAGKANGLKDLENEISDVNDELTKDEAKLNTKPAPDAKEKDRLEKQRSGHEKQITRLERQRKKFELPLKARIEYLKEQLSSKTILSSDGIEKSLTARSSKTGKETFDIDAEREKSLQSNERTADERSALTSELARLEKISNESKNFKDELSKLISQVVKAEHLGIDLGVHKKHDAQHDKDVHADHHGIGADMMRRLQKISSDDLKSLTELYAEFSGLFEDSHKIQELLEKFDAASAEKVKATKDSKKALDKATAASEKEKNLTDAEAAKKIIGSLVWEQFPDLSPMDHNKLVSMILADDVATLQTDEGYESLAQRGSAEELDAVNFVGFRAKLLNFKFKEGEKVTQPFKGLKPDDFKDWANMEKLFLYGKLNYKNAFLVLAAFEDFDNGVKSIQSVKLEKKLKTLLAKQMGVDAHMDKAGISKIVDDAFKAQMEKVRPIMTAHSEALIEKGGAAKENKEKVLAMKYADLNDELRTEKIGQEVYEIKVKALVKEASESDVKVEFSADSAGAQFWNSPEAQWLRNKAHDTGAFLGNKALGIGVVAPLKIIGKGAWGGAKLGASLGFQTAMLPFRAAKYPLLLAAKPLVGFINLFRANKWTPLPGIIDSVKNDAARVVGYTGEKASGVVKGTKDTVTTTASAEWSKVKFADTKYADRNKHEAAVRAELLKVHEPKSDIDPIELADSPFIDLAKYKEQIGMVSKALGITINAPGGHDVKVGHEEAAKKEDGHGHGGEVNKDDHAKHDAAHGHEAPKKAAGGHH